MNYYPFHVADYSMATRHLNFMQDLAYRRMIDLYMRDEKGLPNDAKEIAVLILMPRHWKEVQYIVDRYFFLENSLLRNNRCDIEIEKYQSKASRAKSANTQRWASKIRSETLLKSDVILEPKSDQESEANQNPNNNQNHNHTKTDVLVVVAKAPRTVVVLPSIPDELDTEAFREAWEAWDIHRKEKRIKLTPQSVKMQFKRLIIMGIPRAIKAIEWSISQNYQGIYEEKQQNGYQSKAAQMNDLLHNTHEKDYGVGGKFGGACK